MTKISIDTPVPEENSENNVQTTPEPSETTATKSQDPTTPVTPTPPQKWLRKRRVWIGLAVLVVIGAAGAAGWLLAKPKPVATKAAKPAATATATPVPTTKASALTGQQVEIALADRPIEAVVIENSPEARPQSGLSSAGVVYEANAEGGITRFLAFYGDQRPGIIGPVRSLRTYFVDWALEFNAPVSHAGGNADALDLVKPLGMKDANALSFASSAFYRTTDRQAPHNLYTNSDKLEALMKTLGFSTPPSFTVSPRKADQPNPTPPHPNVHIEYSYNGFQVDYRYDAATNDYGRLLAGTPHIDRNTGKQIRVKNIVVQMMPTSYGTTRIGEQTVIMQTVGSGTGWVMRDGDAIPCTWSKASHNARTILTDSAGKEIPLNPGNTWYSIVPTGKSVTF